MIYELAKALDSRINDATIAERYQLARAKNPLCVVCAKPVETLDGALLLEQNERLAHPGSCTAEALRHAFVFAHSNRKGFRAMRRAS